jgi:hypothetical protein
MNILRILKITKRKKLPFYDFIDNCFNYTKPTYDSKINPICIHFIDNKISLAYLENSKKTTFQSTFIYSCLTNNLLDVSSFYYLYQYNSDVHRGIYDF